MGAPIISPHRQYPTASYSILQHPTEHSCMVSRLCWTPLKSKKSKLGKSSHMLSDPPVCYLAATDRLRYRDIEIPVGDKTCNKHIDCGSAGLWFGLVQPANISLLSWSADWLLSNIANITLFGNLSV